MKSSIKKKIAEFCECLKQNGTYNGDIDLLAQRLNTMFFEELLPIQQRKIYNKLSSTPSPTKEIAHKSKLSSKQVSSQLSQIHKNTNLIGFKKDGRNKFWYKNSNNNF